MQIPGLFIFNFEIQFCRLLNFKSFPPEWADWILPESRRSLNKLVTLLKPNLSEEEHVGERRENELVMRNSAG